MIPMLEENAAGTVCGLVPPLYDLNRSMQLRLYQCCSTLTKI